MTQSAIDLEVRRGPGMEPGGGHLLGIGGSLRSLSFFCGLSIISHRFHSHWKIIEKHHFVHIMD
jgi:hypothetical protein